VQVDSDVLQAFDVCQVGMLVVIDARRVRRLVTCRIPEIVRRNSPRTKRRPGRRSGWESRSSGARPRRQDARKL